MSDVLKVSAGVIRDAEGRVLLCQRGYGAQEGQWEFPGGKCEAGESYEDCLVREIEEELGVRVETTRVLLQMRYAYPDKVIDFAFVEAGFTQGQLQVREHKAVKWLRAEEIDEKELCPADAQAFAQMKAEKLI